MARPWRLAKALERMRTQFNEFAPGRNKGSDGTIGDAAHASRSSDHNPWITDGNYGVVSALDITHDPKNGIDTWAIAEYLRQKRDPRIKYVISNKRIFSSTTSPFVWRKYTGSNPHSSHMHVSVKSTKSVYDDTKDWDIFGTATGGGGGGGGQQQRPTLRRGSSGAAVIELQNMLSLTADGKFGPATESAVKQFQSANGLTPDGVVGPATWAKLDETEGEQAPDPDRPEVRPVLRRGSTGDDVKTVQKLLTVRVDGDFGEVTESAVRAFQRGAGLTPDGVVGPMTWAELDDLEQQPIDRFLQENIEATVFGGKGDPNKSAYEDRWITDEEFGIALPARFPGIRPQVEVINRANGKRVTCDIVDVGPWMTNDGYWTHEARPLAETCFKNKTPLPSGPNAGKIPKNAAGIDLTPGAAREIGLSGKGKVDWGFAEDEDEGTT